MDCRVHKLVADVAVLAEGRVLMVRYRDVRWYDGQRGWFLPDDYLAYLEHPDEAAGRILKEQVGLDTTRLRLGSIESFGNGAWHLVFHYVAELDGAPTVMSGDNVAAAEWFALDALPDRSQVAHEGWGLDVLEKILAER